ncbi:MAG: polysaccharide deacetylase family protein [Myxococcaceae bacterium]
MRRTPVFAASALLLLAACARPPPVPGPSGHETPEAAAKAEADLSHPAPLEPPVLPPVAPEVVAHGSRAVRTVALTFDACSTRDVSQYDQRVTEALIANRTPATIFLGGSWAKEEAAHVRELAQHPELFELENHTFTHPHMPAVKDDTRLRQELLRTQAEVQALTGRTPLLWRPPYGEYDARVVKIAAELGLTTIEYDLASGDPDQHATKEKLVEWVLRKVQPGSIVVMHINHLKFHTSEALPGIIQGLRARGYQLVTVGEMLRESHGLALKALDAGSE